VHYVSPLTAGTAPGLRARTRFAGRRRRGRGRGRLNRPQPERQADPAPGHLLPRWIKAAEGRELPPLHSFARNLNKDFDAVTAGLTLPYSSGMVEGHVNRIKFLKRQGYGRANFDLLRRRILLGN